MLNILAILATIPLFSHQIPSAPPQLPLAQKQPQILATHEFSMNDRYDNTYVAGVFKDNILLNLAYMQGTVQAKNQVNWPSLEQPFEYRFRLNPGQTFAFHDQVLPKYAGRVQKTTNAHFNWQEGFKSDGYLTGDGVCHLASLMYWTAKDAGLEAEAPTNHDFMKIPQVPKEDGVSIYSVPGNYNTSANQNLYITNNQNGTTEFKFVYDGNNLKVSVLKLG